MNKHKACELYESLSKEFVRRGISSSKFSELENLYQIAKESEQLKNKLEEVYQELQFYKFQESGR